MTAPTQCLTGVGVEMPQLPRPWPGLFPGVALYHFPELPHEIKIQSLAVVVGLITYPFWADSPYLD